MMKVSQFARTQGGASMLTNISVIIPFQTDRGPRERIYHWVRKFYAQTMPEAELVLGFLDDKEINKSKAVNQAVKQATKDILVLADADVVYDPNLIAKAILHVHQAAMVVPFTEIRDMNQPGTERLLAAEPVWPVEVKQEENMKSPLMYEGFAGKLIVMHRKHFEAVGGFDERFIGWGGEDDAFSLSVRTICGELVNLEGAIYHMWHPPSTYRTNPHGKANRELLQRYDQANGNQEAMLKLIHERGTQ